MSSPAVGLPRRGLPVDATVRRAVQAILMTFSLWFALIILPALIIGLSVVVYLHVAKGEE